MIVVVADGSRAGLRAVEWAAREAADRAVPLHVMHALPAKRAVRTPREVGLGDVALRQARTAALAAEPRILVTTASIPGDPRPALIEAAREAELLVIGDHGLVYHGLGTFREPPLNSAGLSVPPCVLCGLLGAVVELTVPAAPSRTAAPDPPLPAPPLIIRSGAGGAVGE